MKKISFHFNSFFKNIISIIQPFYIRPDVPVNIRVFLFISHFLAESLKTNKNQRKRSLILQYSFAQKTLLILGTSTHVTLKIICSRNIGKNLCNFTNFPGNFCLVFEKNICTVPFLDAQEMHSWSTLKANVCSVYLGKKLFVPKTK